MALLGDETCESAERFCRRSLGDASIKGHPWACDKLEYLGLGHDHHCGSLHYTDRNPHSLQMEHLDIFKLPHFETN